LNKSFPVIFHRGVFKRTSLGIFSLLNLVTCASGLSFGVSVFAES
jgi:hypothetical protein